LRQSVDSALFFEGGRLRKYRTIVLVAVAISLLAALATASGFAVPSAPAWTAASAQESYPSAPTDRTQIYIADDQRTLKPLAVEAGSTPLHVESVAKGDKRSFVEIKGASAATVILNDDPRFYLFVPDDPSAKPPLIVAMAAKNGTRRVTAMAQKGYKGFAIMSDEIIKPHYRVLSRDGGMIFMEIRPREPLMMGEYAIIGADLQRISTFRVGVASHN
jgi:hypothetical protein